MPAAESDLPNTPEEQPSEATPKDRPADEEILAGVDEHATETPAEKADLETGAHYVNDLPPHADYGILPVVGLGGSAGSIQALQQFFSTMPADSGLAFVVVLHLAPDFESELPRVLQQHTAMPVVAVTEQVKAEANHVYVIPPGKHLVMHDSTIHLSELEPQYGKRVAVDLFFRSLAATHRSHAVAVVLSGMDSDGAIGIKRIKEHGGVTIAQDPAEAEHDSMPRAAIQTGMVDWVLPVAQMAERLVDLARNERLIQLPPPEPPALQAAPDGQPADSAADEAALREVISFLQARTGHDFTHYKRATVLRRIGRRLQVNSLTNLPDYLTFLRTHVGEAGALLQDLLISVTNFFRDPEAFAALEAHLPVLFAGKKAGDQVRVWVAGCATGEEAYSIAMMLVEYADKMSSPPSIQVFATDIDEEATRAARDGRYPQSIAADVSPERLRRFFMLDQGFYRVRSDLREIVLFASHNLLRDSPFSRLDLITCRNLLIYFQPEAQDKVFNLFHFALRPDGLLFLGGSEAVDESSGLFTSLDKKHRIYGRREVVRPLSMPPLPIPAPLHLPDTRSILASVPLQEQGFALRSRERVVPGFGDLHLHLLEQYAPPSVLVNADYDILHLSQRAGRFLRFVGGGVSTNLLTVVNPALRLELRSALFRAVQSGASVDVPELTMEIEGEARFVDIRVRPLRDDERPEGPVHYLLVVFDDRATDLPPSVVLSRSEEDSVTRRLERELQHSKEHLRATVEQYEATTEELKASNEELQAMNEELRSAGEELETSKEELQAANEELITINQEMKSKVEELARSNSDLQNLMAATNIATIFLDRTLCIKRYTQPAVELFNLIPTDTGRPLSDLRHSLRYGTMIQDAEQALEHLVPIENEVLCNDGRWFLVRVMPYRTVEDRIDGVVFTFVDITQRIAAETRLRESLERTTEILESINDAFYTVDADFRFTYINKKAEELWGRPRETLIGKHYWTEFPAAVGSESYRMHQQVMAERQSVHYETVSPLLNRWIDVSLYPNEGGGLSCYFRDISERRQVQDILHISQERFRLLVESVHDFAIFTLTPDGRVDLWNPGAEKIFGYTKDEIIGQSGAILFTPEDRERGEPEKELETARREGRAADERWHLRKDGSRFFASGINTLLGNDPNQGFVKVARDLTEQKRAQELRNRLATVIEVSSDAIITFDLNQTILNWNQGARRMFGYTTEEALGERIQMIVPPEHGEEVDRIFHILRRGDSVPDFETHCLCKDKRLVPVSISASPMCDASDNLMGASLTMRDISAQKQIQEVLRQSRDELEGRVRERTQELSRMNDELRHSEERFSRAFHSSPIPITIASLEDGRIVNANEAALRFFDLPREAVIGRLWKQLGQWSSLGLDTPEEFQRVLHEQGTIRNREIEFRTHSGAERQAINNIVMVQQEGGAYLLSMLLDVTERKQSEAARLQLLRQLVSAEEEERKRIARELHDHMGQQTTALLLGLKAMRETRQGHTDALEGIERLQSIVETLDREVDRLALELRPASLDDLGLRMALTQHLEDWLQRTGVQVDFHCRGMGRRLPIEVETTLYRVVQEALTNIAKHAAATRVSVVIERRGDWVRAVIEDNGKGFNVEAARKRPDARRQLGLSGMRERVALWGGDFDIESKPGKGTTIFVRIPLKLAPKEHSEIPTIQGTEIHETTPHPTRRRPRNAARRPESAD